MKIRNAEAARAVVDDYLNFLLDSKTLIPLDTGAGVDLDGDGIPDGVPCAAINATATSPGRIIPNPLPLVETRAAAPTAIVSGVLYWRVQAVGSTFGLPAANNTDIVQVNFTLAYEYRGQTYYFKAMTYKAKND